MIRIWVCTIALVFAACDYNRMKETAGGPGGPGGGALDEKTMRQPDFNAVLGAVIGPKCLGCHANATGNQGGVNLETYSAVRAKLQRVEVRTMVKRDMPPPTVGALSGPQFEVFKNWIDGGAPELVAGIGEKPSDGDLEKGPTDWAKIRDRVLAPKCAGCHAADLPAMGIVLTDLNEVRKNIVAIFDTVSNKRSMPPAPLAGLTKTERRVLFQWIDSGMPE